MKKLLLTFLAALVFACNSQAAYFSARGLQNTLEYWSSFRNVKMVIHSESFYGFTLHTVYGTYSIDSDYNGHLPSNQPFEVTWNLYLPADAIITNAQLLVGETWLQAEPEEVLIAESIYDENSYSTPRFLLRELVSRNYYGTLAKSHELKFGPVYNNKRFAVVLTFLTRNVTDVQAMRNTFPTEQFIVNNYYYDRKWDLDWFFKDYDNPDSKPVFINLDDQVFNKTTDGWWETKTNQMYYSYDNLVLKWDCNFLARKEMRLFKNGDDCFYHTTIAPPLTPVDRKKRRILIINDLIPELCYDRTEIINNIKTISQLCLANTDSLNLMYIDGLAPSTLFPAFIPATSGNITTLFNELTSQQQVKISGLPQLLRAAKDYFNMSGQGGEIWFLSTSYSHSNPPSIANEIMDLSFYQLDYPVIFRIIDCSAYHWYSYTYVNGIYYYGNDYLYQNLARLSNGGLLSQYNTGASSPYDMLLAVADLLAPAVEMAKIELEPAGGYSFSKYSLFGDRTHFPITFPYMEIGRYEGNLPFDARFFGLVDGDLLTKSQTFTVNDTTRKDNNSFIETIWYAKYLDALLNQPQSYATIEKIGQLSKEKHIVTPYCAFVIPAPDGYKGFKRLVELDSLGNEYIDQDQAEAPLQTPDAMSLCAWPNPFNANTTIQITLPPSAYSRIAEIRIIDVLGRLVKIIKQDMESSQFELKISWDGCSDSGLQVSSGLYFVQCITGSYTQTLKITYLK